MELDERRSTGIYLMFFKGNFKKNFVVNIFIMIFHEFFESLKIFRKLKWEFEEFYVYFSS